MIRHARLCWIGFFYRRGVTFSCLSTASACSLRCYSAEKSYALLEDPSQINDREKRSMATRKALCDRRLLWFKITTNFVLFVHMSALRATACFSLTWQQAKQLRQIHNGSKKSQSTSTLLSGQGWCQSAEWITINQSCVKSTEGKGCGYDSLCIKRNTLYIIIMASRQDHSSCEEIFYETGNILELWTFIQRDLCLPTGVRGQNHSNFDPTLRVFE